MGICFSQFSLFRIWFCRILCHGYSSGRHVVVISLVIVIVQATPPMSTSHISILALMPKWFYIPNIFSLYIFAFQLCLCRKWLTWSNGYLGVIFHALDIFSITFATAYVEVKNQLSHGHMRRIVCFGYVYALPELRKSSKQWSKTINPHLPSGLSHPYQLDESISNFRCVWCTFSFLFNFE